MKKIYRYKDGRKWVEEEVCHPQKLALTSKYIYPYWYDPIKRVFAYEKQRGLVDIHKLVSDDRIIRGLKLLRKGNLIDWTITKGDGGDARVAVRSQDGKNIHTVIIKNYLPKTLPQYQYERENYIADMVTTCDCQDHMQTRGKSNSSMFCIHIMCVLWHLIDKFNMPKIFISPEERMLGWKKSDIIEQTGKIMALPLLEFTPYLRVLTLLRHRGMGTATGISMHRQDNKTLGEWEKARWGAYTERVNIEKIIKGLIVAYKEMNIDRDIKESREELVDRFFGKEEKSLAYKIIDETIRGSHKETVKQFPKKEKDTKKSCDNCRYCRIQDFTPDPLCWYYESKEISRFACTLPASNICEHWEKKQIKIV